MKYEDTRNIAKLRDLDDYEVADHDPDVRGWDVMSADGRRIGEVDDLLVDRAAMKVRYLDVELDEDYRGTDRDRHILIPVGRAQLHESNDNVLVNGLDAATVGAIPAYSGRIDRDYENTLRTHFGGTDAAAADTDFYSGRDFDENTFYGTRRGTAGRGSTGRGD